MPVVKVETKIHSEDEWKVICNSDQNWLGIKLKYKRVYVFDKLTGFIAHWHGRKYPSSKMIEYIVYCSFWHRKAFGYIGKKYKTC